MRKDSQRGASMLEDMLVLVGVLIIIFIFVIPDNGPSLRDARGGTSTGGTTVTSNSSRNSTPRDVASKVVALGRGSAASSYQPAQEYVTISNRSDSPLDITGWKLANAKHARGEERGGRIVYPARDEATIPRASLTLSTSGGLLQNVVLQPGDKAIVTSGSYSLRNPSTFTSFKENACSGYLNDSREYTFTPSLSSNCPRPRDEVGVSSLPVECQDFIRGLSSCRIPDFTPRDRSGENCPNCVNGERVSGMCADFIKARYNYNSCVALHSSDSDFSGNTWRVFLGRGWEMWAEDHETIYLYDQLGNLVTSLSY